MALNKQIQEASDQLKSASMRLHEARAKHATQETYPEWLSALTDYVLALGEIHDLNMEALQERMEDIIQRQRRASAVID
jgi:hypothetical protein